jgi:hypothetical protein
VLQLDEGVACAAPPTAGGARGLYYLKVGAAALGGGALLALTGARACGRAGVLPPRCWCTKLQRRRLYFFHRSTY